MIGALLALTLTGAPCDLRDLRREEERLSRIILALPDGDPKLRSLFPKYDRAVAEVDACKAQEADRQPPGT